MTTPTAPFAIPDGPCAYCSLHAVLIVIDDKDRRKNVCLDHVERAYHQGYTMYQKVGGN